MTLAAPETFSFIDAPDEALQTINTLVQLARGGAPWIHFDQQACTTIDLCAGSLFNVLAADARVRLKTRFGGIYPAANEPLEIVAATGLPTLLRIPLPALPSFDVFRLRHGGTTRSSLFKPTAKETAAADLNNYLAACFARCGHRLTPEGRHRIGKLVGEVLTNAEDHANGHDWYVAAYLRQPENHVLGDCHITIFNFGPTLAETLRAMPAGDYRSDIEELVAHHRTRDFFGIIRRRWSEEGLWTVYALQEGVSRFNTTETSRGVGTADMIEEFQRLGQTRAGHLKPRMCVVSGHTHVLFDGRHKMALAPMDDGSYRRIIAFNAPNQLLEPPDENTVTHLSHFFPGTLISLRFYIDYQYLSNIQGAA